MPDQSIRGRFLWHELMTSDPSKALAFYKKVIGWEKQDWDQDPSYTIVSYKGSAIGGLMALPAEARATKALPSWTAYIGTPDVHVTAWDAQRLGAKLHKAPTKAPNVGTWAILLDPQGAPFGLYTPENAPKDGAEAAVGDFSWHELATTNHAAAFDFYHELFGWKKIGSYDMGPDGTYLTFGLGKQTFGGLYTMGARERNHPPHWVSYVRVTDAKRMAAGITAAGGSVIVGPMEVPGGDWIAVAKDPQGATFAVHAKPAKAKRKAPAKKSAPKKAAGKKKTSSKKKKGKKK